MQADGQRKGFVNLSACTAMSSRRLRQRCNLRRKELSMIEFEFCFKVLRESIWVVKLNASSFADRPKLTSAFRKLIKRAGDDLDHLGGARVFAPSEDMMGGFLNGPPAPWIY